MPSSVSAAQWNSTPGAGAPAGRPSRPANRPMSSSYWSFVHPVPSNTLAIVTTPPPPQILRPGVSFEEYSEAEYRQGGEPPHRHHRQRNPRTAGPAAFVVDVRPHEAA